MTTVEQEQIYTQYRDKVLRYLCGKVNDLQLAEELCSDVFLKVYEKLDVFDPAKASISTWIYTITRNTLTDYFRTRRIFSEIPETLDDGTSLEESYCDQELLEHLADALEKLEERQRDIIILHYYSGYTLKEVGAKMGLSYAYIKALHSKALSAMRKTLE